jgi:hypothetical protein
MLLSPLLLLATYVPSFSCLLPLLLHLLLLLARKQLRA